MDQQVRQAAAQQLQQLQQARAPPHHHGQVMRGGAARVTACLCRMHACMHACWPLPRHAPASLCACWADTTAARRLLATLPPAPTPHADAATDATPTCTPRAPQGCCWRVCEQGPRQRAQAHDSARGLALLAGAGGAAHGYGGGRRGRWRHAARRHAADTQHAAQDQPHSGERWRRLPGWQLCWRACASCFRSKRLPLTLRLPACSHSPAACSDPAVPVRAGGGQPARRPRHHQ